MTRPPSQAVIEAAEQALPTTSPTNAVTADQEKPCT